MLCLNLAISLGETGLSTLLVDGDLRSRALTNWVASVGSESNGEIQATPWPGVFFLGAPVQGDQLPGDVLMLPDFKKRMTGAFGNYSVVLVDSPALVDCSDALLLGRWVDAALMAICKQRFRGVPEGNFSEDLRASGVHLLGSVLT